MNKKPSYLGLLLILTSLASIACEDGTSLLLRVEGQSTKPTVLAPTLVNRLEVEVLSAGEALWNKDFDLDGEPRALDETLVLHPGKYQDADLDIRVRAYFGGEKRAEGSLQSHFSGGETVEQVVTLSWLETLCMDTDGDGYGAGGACLGYDCDESSLDVHAGAEERCNGLDDNCNDVIDDELQIPDCPLTQGVCAGSQPQCAGELGWQSCGVAEYGEDYEPIEQSCDGLDNDCDGEVDNIGPDYAPLCPLTLGVCAIARQSCGGIQGWRECGLQNYGDHYQFDEADCDGLDNDCDGETDEGVQCPSCQFNADCGDDNSCTQDSCVEGRCRFVRRDAGAPCNDGQFCRTNDRCDETGFCLGELVSPCDQVCNTVCNETLDRCEPNPVGSQCPEDGAYCNGVERCDGAGHCASPGSPCAETDCQHCQEDSDSCLDPVDTACASDGVFCNGDESCDGAGSCAQHSGDPCPGTPCNTCQEDLESCFDPNTVICDDGDPCQELDYCDGAGQCSPGPATLDVDNDSHIAKDCGGDDCEDSDPNIPVAHEGPVCDLAETCFDGLDNDCDDLTDDLDSDCQVTDYLCLSGPSQASVHGASPVILHLRVQDLPGHAPQDIDPSKIICFSDSSRALPPSEFYRCDFNNNDCQDWSFSHVFISGGQAVLQATASMTSADIDTRGFARVAVDYKMGHSGLDGREFLELRYRVVDEYGNGDWQSLNIVGDSVNSGLMHEFAHLLPDDALQQERVQLGFWQNASLTADQGIVDFIALRGLASPTQSHVFVENNFELSDGVNVSTANCIDDTVASFVQSADEDAQICIDSNSQYPGSAGPDEMGLSMSRGSVLISEPVLVGWRPKAAQLELHRALGIDAVSDSYGSILWREVGTGDSVFLSKRKTTGDIATDYAAQTDLFVGGFLANARIEVWVLPNDFVTGDERLYLDDFKLAWTLASHDVVGPFVLDQATGAFNAELRTDQDGVAEISCVYLGEDDNVLTTSGDITHSQPLMVQFLP